MYNRQSDQLLPFGSIGRSFWLFSILLPALAFAQDRKTSQAQQPLAIFDGQPIAENQLPVADQTQLVRMLQQVYTVRLRGLHAIVDQKLIESEAKRKGLSVEDLLKAELIVPNPTDAEVSEYYQSRQGQMEQPLEAVKEQIRQGLKSVAIQKARTVYLDGLLQQAVNNGQLVFLLSPPRVPVTADPQRTKGDSAAPIIIIEFSDYSCTYCQKVESTMKQLLAKYNGKIKLGYRDFPLRQLHPHAELAAEASRCAAEQGKFWEYHDLLFANLDKQDTPDLEHYASILKLDQSAFDTCLSTGRFKPQVEQDLQLAIRAGILAAPGFLVNDTFIDGAQPLSTFEKIIDEQLSSSVQHSAEARPNLP